MAAVVVYDSQWGNTEAVARAIASALGPDTRVDRATALSPTDLAGVDLLVVGSPTQGGRPLASVTQLLTSLPATGLAGVRVAAFDTRLPMGERGFALRLPMRTIGFAAPKIAKQLESKGGRLAAPPEGFLVRGQGRTAQARRTRACGRLGRSVTGPEAVVTRPPEELAALAAYHGACRRRRLDHQRSAGAARTGAPCGTQSSVLRD